MMRYFLTSCFLLFLAVSCSKRPNPVTSTPDNKDTTGGGHTTKPDSSVSIRFTIRNTVEGGLLKLNTGIYLNENGDSFTVTDYTYYISNIRLRTDAGAEYKQPESYYLISEEEPNSKTFVVKDLPAGSYTKVFFLIGVDSARNVSGAQTGALDPLHGMFWDWNTGYVMARMEGKSPASSSGTFAYHVGGYAGFYSAVKEVNLDLPQPAIAIKGKKPVIYLQSNIAEWFKTPFMIDFSDMPIVTSTGTNAAMIAENYMDMFRIDSVANK